MRDFSARVQYSRLAYDAEDQLQSAVRRSSSSAKRLDELVSFLVSDLIETLEGFTVSSGNESEFPPEPFEELLKESWRTQKTVHIKHNEDVLPVIRLRFEVNGERFYMGAGFVDKPAKCALHEYQFSKLSAPVLVHDALRMLIELAKTVHTATREAVTVQD